MGQMALEGGEFMKVYRVQDLASYGRKITVDGVDVQFEGFYATVPEPIIYWFNRNDEFQVSQPTILPDLEDIKKEVEGAPESVMNKVEDLTNPNAELTAIKYVPKTPATTSPNIETITAKEVVPTKPKDDNFNMKVEKVKVSELIKPRTAQK